ncbi:MAG: hypothetical protein HY866_10055, partial [Chloroflexi bacterium]|nr:hypothetical protein [Chloroflexota bacterium]
MVRLTKLFSLGLLALWLITALLPAAAQIDPADDEQAITALVETMAEAVIEQDGDAYLSV